MARPVLDYLKFFYPRLVRAEGSEDGFSPEDVALAIEVAEDYRPGVVSETLSNQAVAHYAAYLLLVKQYNTLGESSERVVKREQEGTASIEYEYANSEGIKTKPYDLWLAIGKMGMSGAILTRWG